MTSCKGYAAALLLGLWGGMVAPASSTTVISEVFYDASGSDAIDAGDTRRQENRLTAEFLLRNMVA
ncbi:hypothetical protein MNBD_GAMMA15-278 [hydrothermal vent metagenome]|uniref:Uncharacterized protein n=1 Tax=hydrothermal vent metagenome TaxID=652676 RepID=A0A3B0Y966_9ZZZZ